MALHLRLGRLPREDRSGLAACLAIGVGGFVLLSLIATKREVYLVPLLPFVAAAQLGLFYAWRDAPSFMIAWATFSKLSGERPATSESIWSVNAVIFNCSPITPVDAS